MKRRISIFQIVFIAMMAQLILSPRVEPQGIDKGRDKQMGYCFDAAYHSGQNRLYVVAGVGGMHVFDVSQGNLNFVTTVYDEGYYRNIKIQGDRAFVADAGRGMIVFDISQKIPSLTWKWQDPTASTPGTGIYVQSEIAYLAVGLGDENFERPGIYTFNISNPDSPEFLGYCKTTNAWDVWVNGDVAHVADLHGGLCVIDVSSPTHPKEIGRITWDEKYACAEIVRGEGHYAYVAAGWKIGLVVIDVADPANPEVTGTFQSGPDGCGEGLCVKDGWVYLANGNNWYPDENGLYIIDVHRSDHPVTVGKYAFEDWVEGICIVDNYAFITNTGSGVKSFDVSDPKNPRLIDSFGPTCRQEIEYKLFPIILRDGITPAIAKYHELLADSTEAYIFSENGLNRLGYRLLQQGKIDEAVEIFKLNVEAYPESFNVYDSLGEAYMTKGEMKLAVKNYKKSLELNPDNTNAVKMLKKIREQQ